MTRALPQTMRALRLKAYDDGPVNLALETVPVPYPALGQLLVKVSASPINPADLLFCRGRYGFRRPLPTTPGFEGSGVVVASGGGLVANLLVGRRVAFGVQEGGDGLWAEYAVCDAATAVPLWPALSDEQGATLLVNPATAIALLDVSRAAGHRGLVSTAAASAVGRMILRLARRERVPAIHVVRRPAQAELLRRLGAEVVIDTSAPDALPRLRRATRELGATALFDAVGGPLTGELLEAMPDGSEAWVYGLLAGQPVQAGLDDLVFRRKRVQGFWLSDWLKDRGVRALVTLTPRLRRLLGSDLSTAIAERVSLDGVVAALGRYEADMTRGKVLVLPGA